MPTLRVGALTLLVILAACGRTPTAPRPTVCGVQRIPFVVRDVTGRPVTTDTLLVWRCQ